MAEKNRRDWIIALSAAVVGAIALPFTSHITKMFRAAPRVVVEEVYGPYATIPDVTLRTLGYTPPKSFDGLELSGELNIGPFEGASGIASEVKRSAAGPADIAPNFGDPARDLELFQDYFVDLRIKNLGQLPAQQVIVQVPYPGVGYIKRNHIDDVVYLKTGGSRIPIGSIQPGNEEQVRLWLRYPGYDIKPFGALRVLYDGRLAIVHRRGPDYIVNYFAAWTGPLLLISAAVGFLLLCAALLSLAESGVRFLFFPAKKAGPRSRPNAKKNTPRGGSTPTPSS